MPHIAIGYENVLTNVNSVSGIMGKIGIHRVKRAEIQGIMATNGCFW
jgi:hypothetical protein